MSAPAPAVSVVVIFLNAAAYLQEALDSVYAQTFTDWELVLVDDGGVDGTDAVARSAAAARPDRVRCVAHEGRANRGTSISRNLGLELARGEHVLYLDADDLLTPDCLSRLVNEARAHPEAAAVFARTLFWYWDSRYEGRLDHVQDYGGWTGRTADPPGFLSAMTRDEDLHPANCSCLIRRSALVTAGGFDLAFPGMYEDTALLAKLLLTSPVRIVADVLSLYRLHFASQCHQAMSSGSYAVGRPNPSRKAYLLWLRAYARRLGLGDRTLRQAVRRELWEYQPVLHHLGRVRLLRRLFVALRTAVRRLGGERPAPGPAAAKSGQDAGDGVLAAVQDFYAATGRPGLADGMAERRRRRARTLPGALRPATP